MITIRRVADGLIRLSAIIGALALLFQVIAIFVDVVLRSQGMPIAGRQDASMMAMVLVVFGGMAICDKVGGHIKLDILEERFPGWVNRTGDVLSALLGAAIFVAIAWGLYTSAQISMMLPRRTNILDLPIAWFQLAAVAFSIVTAAGMTLRAIELVATRRNVQQEDADKRAGA